MIGIELGGGLVALVTFLLAFESAPAAGAGAGGCALDAAQQRKVEAYARDLLANATCALNITF